MATDLRLALLVLGVAFVPPLLFLALVRSAERFNREPWHAVVRSFLWGAFGAVLLALVGEQALMWYYGSGLQRPQQLERVFELPEVFFLVLVAAPLIEELAKAWGLRGRRREMDEVEDGLVYGAAIGFGFAATENLFYEVDALLSGGEDLYWATVIVRTVSGTFLHASTVALVGYGYSSAVVERRMAPWLWATPYFVLAVLIHAGFNGLASANETWALFAVIAVSVLLMLFIVGRIRHLDRTNRQRTGGFFSP